MLAMIAVLTVAKKAARLLCKRLRASLVAELFARALKSLRRGIADYIAVFRLPVPPPSPSPPFVSGLERVQTAARRASKQQRQRWRQRRRRIRALRGPGRGACRSRHGGGQSRAL